MLLAPQLPMTPAHLGRDAVSGHAAARPKRRDDARALGGRAGRARKEGEANGWGLLACRRAGGGRWLLSAAGRGGVAARARQLSRGARARACASAPHLTLQALVGALEEGDARELAAAHVGSDALQALRCGLVGAARRAAPLVHCKRLSRVRAGGKERAAAVVARGTPQATQACFPQGRRRSCARSLPARAPRGGVPGAPCVTTRMPTMPAGSSSPRSAPAACAATKAPRRAALTAALRALRAGALALFMRLVSTASLMTACCRRRRTPPTTCSDATPMSTTLPPPAPRTNAVSSVTDSFRSTASTGRSGAASAGAPNSALVSPPTPIAWTVAPSPSA